MAEGKIGVPPPVVVADLRITHEVDRRLGIPLEPPTMEVEFVFLEGRPPKAEEAVEAIRRALASVLPTQPKEPKPAMKLCYCGRSARYEAGVTPGYGFFYCPECTRRAPSAGSRDAAITAWNWMVQDTKDAIELAKRKHMTGKEK